MLTKRKANEYGGQTSKSTRIEESSDSDSYDYGEEEEEDEEEEDEEIDFEQESEGQPQSKGEEGLYRLPTKDEQLQIHNTDNLMKSNLLRLQTDEMLAEVSAIGDFEKKKVKAWLEDVISLLQDGGGISGQQVTASWLKSSGGVSLNCEKNTMLTFQPPVSVDVIGSYKLKTSTAPMFNIDLAVEMPPNCFEQKDILNHEYFIKRNLYLGACWVFLLKSERYSVTAGLFKGDSRKPVLILRPKLFKSKTSIRIVPVLPANVFKLKQLRPSKNNVRPEYWTHAIQDSKRTHSNMVLDPAILPGTPNYNSSILEDVALKTQFKILSQTMSTCPVARDVVILFKTWLTQRNMRFTLDSFDSHYATLLVAYLAQVKRISSHMTLLAGFQVTLRFLSVANFSTTTYDFMSTKATSREGDIGWPFVLTHPLIDTSNGDDVNKREIVLYNCMWRVKSTALDDLVVEARKSLRCFDSNAKDTFNRLFMTKSSFYDRHDMFFHIPFHKSSLHGLKEIATTAENADISSQVLTELKNSLCDKTPSEYLSEKIAETLKEALGNRVAIVRVTYAPNERTEDTIFPSQWSEASLSSEEHWTVTIGLILQKDSSFRRVDRGPSAESAEECERFRRFWGPTRSKLRRFQDGSIIEAVVWDDGIGRAANSNCIPRGERIVEEVVRHILGRHVPIPSGARGENIQCKASLLEQEFLPAPGIIGDKVIGTSICDSDTLSRKAVEALDFLRSILISKVKDLPLVIESIMGASPMLRYTSLIPPHPHPLLDKDLQRSLRGSEISLVALPISIIAKIESGGKWPTDAKAISNVKTALYLRLGELLASQFDIHSVPHTNSLDVILRGYIFRLELFAAIEIERRVSDVLTIVRKGTIAALHHNAVKALHSQFPSYGNAVRLLVRWCAGNHFTGMISHEALELITATCYLVPEFGVAPSTPSAGFRRALLKIMSHDWENAPLFVDFACDLSIDDDLAVVEKFNSCKEQGKGFAMFIVSSCDKATGFIPSATSDTTPCKNVLRLIVASAISSLESLDKWTRSVHECHELMNILMDSAVEHLADVTLPFVKPIVALKRQRSGNALWEAVNHGPPFARLKLFANMSNRETALSNLIVRSPGFTPCPVQEEVVARLRHSFGDVAIILWNGIVGSEISIVWNPSSFLPEKFKILRVANRLVVMNKSNENFSVLNSAEIIANMLAVADGNLDPAAARFH